MTSEMSRSNFDKPFYVDVGTSVVAIRCESNHDVLMRYDYSLRPNSLNFAKGMCNRMNREVEISRPLRNCDVGTAEEQDTRHSKWCCHYGIDGKMEVACASQDCSLCVLRWAQMPYEEGAKNGE